MLYLIPDSGGGVAVLYLRDDTGGQALHVGVGFNKVSPWNTKPVLILFFYSLDCLQIESSRIFFLNWLISRELEKKE